MRRSKRISALCLLAGWMLLCSGCAPGSEKAEPPAITASGNLECVQYSSFSGTFPEDGSGRQVNNVAAILVHNSSAEFLDYAKVSCAIGNESGTFLVTGLPPGTMAWVLEKDAKTVEVDEDFAALQCREYSFRQDAVLAMVISIIPPTAFAAVGDRIPGETGIVSDANGKNVTTNDTISMPIRIYDYRADGMLFEYTEGGTGWYVTGGYGGGAPEPDYPTYNRNFINGDAFTSSYSKWTGVNYVKNRATVSEGKFQDFIDVGYARFENTGTNRPHWWLADFANEDGTYVSKNDVRYVVMVYRTDDSFDDGQNIRFAWAVSADSYSTDYSYYGGAIDIASVDYRYTSAAQDVKKSTEWTYLVYDIL